MTDGNAGDVLGDLRAAVNDLSRLYEGEAAVDGDTADAEPPADRLCDDQVDEHHGRVNEEPDISPEPDGAADDRSWTAPEPWDRGDVIDPDRVKLERSPDYDVSGRWWAVIGEGTAKRLVGTLRPDGWNRKKWHAELPGLLPVPHGPWQTRQKALVSLVNQYRWRPTS